MFTPRRLLPTFRPEPQPEESDVAQRHVLAQRLSTIFATAFLVAALAFTAAAFVAPRDTFGATLTKVASCGVNLRASASSSARIRSVIKTGTKVTVVTSVTGSSYRTTCAGQSRLRLDLVPDQRR